MDSCHLQQPHYISTVLVYPGNGKAFWQHCFDISDGFRASSAYAGGHELSHTRTW